MQVQDDALSAAEEKLWTIRVQKSQSVLVLNTVW